MADSDLEKTEPASSRRISQAREEGQVPQSRELGTFLSLFVAAIVLWTISRLAGEPAWWGWLRMPSCAAPRMMLLRITASAADWMP